MAKSEQHLTKEELASLSSSPDKIRLLTHIASCPICSRRLSEALSAQEQLPAPHYMKRNILGKARRMEQKKREFHTYCMKVGLAVAASLAIVLLSSATDLTAPVKRLPNTYTQQKVPQETPDLSMKIYRSTNKINQKIVDFTDSLFN